MGLVALATLKTLAGLQVRVFIGAVEAAGFALRTAVVSILPGLRAALYLRGGRVGAHQQPQAKE